MSTTIRSKVDNELLKRVGSWFSVREIQDTLRINPATLKPLIMKYAREELLKRRHIKGTARSVQFSPAAKNVNDFKKLISSLMPYRPIVTGKAATKSAKTELSAKKSSAVKAVSAKKSVTKKSSAKGSSKSKKSSRR